MRFIFSTNKIVIRVQIKIIRNREKIILEQMSNFIKKKQGTKNVYWCKFISKQ